MGESIESRIQLAREFDFVPVHRRLLSDTLTPVTAFRLLDDGGPGCLFESVIGGEKVGRYSILASKPLARFWSKGRDYFYREIKADTEQIQGQADDPLSIFRGHLAFRVAPLADLPPFIGGAIGYAGYDTVRYVEKLPESSVNDRDLPDLDFGFYHTLCVFDNVGKTITVVHLADCRGISDQTEATEIQEILSDARTKVDQTIEQLSHPEVVTAPETWDVEKWNEAIAESPLRVTSNMSQETFEDAVRSCVEYIRAGDIFQVVPSQRMEIESDIDPLEIYRSLRVVNPSPFMFYVRTPNCVLVGCSPEVMVRVADKAVTVRPLAGTRPRGATEAEDRELERELLADPKERAEHVMLVDLGRNDVGRVARYGTISLTEVMIVERYSHVMHISSEVQGQLRDGLDAFDALKAALPAGTVSGAPKVRAMEVIDEIEPHRRGPYGGAVGYIDYRGNMDTCIALRTMVIADGKIHVQAGCGVVADSDPTTEYQETVNKAAAMIRAVQLTHQRLQG
ncbi:MAG: anthranilate synthase component I [Planctomycetota bacterium]